jgi:hypothetical protein
MAIRGRLFVAVLLVLTLVAITPAFAGDREKMGDAWWTGPLQTPNAGTIPKNHWYVETYFAVTQTNGTFDNGGTKYGANSVAAANINNGFQGYSNNFASTTLFTYGVTNKFNLQLLPSFSGTQGGTDVTSSNGMSVDMLRIRLPYKLHSYKEGKALPTFSIVPEVNTPVAANSVWNPGIGFWAIRPFWMPGGRILRIRASEDIWFPMGGKNVNVLANPSCGVGAVTCGLDKAKYGVTQVGMEYSLTKHWVPAWDFVWYYAGQNKYNNVAAIGSNAAGAPVTLKGGRLFAVDPALEYNFTENTGIIFGAEVAVSGRNVGSYIAPQIALQWFK